ncbi:MAG: hypothetical protein ACRD0B_03555 [Acidimicrobiales bacterium]
MGQHEPSGGGRSIPQHRRLTARAAEPEGGPRVEEELGPGLRRVWVRRSAAEIAAAGARLEQELAAMTAPGVLCYPNPSVANCTACPYLRPCLAMNEGGDGEAVLAAGFAPRPGGERPERRLGLVTWSTGRGAAPPGFDSER